MISTLPAVGSRRQPPFFRLAFLHKALGLKRTRARLALLDDRLLRDIGLTREDALAEAARPLWDVPTHWRG